MGWNIRLKIGLAILLLFIVVAFGISWLAPVDPAQQSSYLPYLPVSAEHLLGTNALGQDIFWFLTVSVRNSLLLGLGVAACTTVISLAVGLAAGYHGGIADRLIMLVNDSFIVIPTFPILIVLSSLVRGRAGFPAIVAILIAFGWAFNGRTIRSVALSVREREFVHMARFSGCGTARIVSQEIFPYVYAYAVVGYINAILYAINVEAALAIIGLSDVETPTLGSAVYWANTYSAIMTGNYVWIGAPVVAISLLFLGLFLTSTGYNERFAERRGHS